MKNTCVQFRPQTRFFAVFLCLVVFLSVFLCGSDSRSTAITSVSGHTKQGLAAVYSFSEYDIALRNAKYVKNHADDGKMLTDRVFTTAVREKPDDPLNGWMMAESYDGTTDFRVTVTMDLGFLAKGVCHFFARCYSADDIFGAMPEKLRFYVSPDGEDFEYVGQGSTTTDISVSYSAAVYRLTTSKEYTARYIRAVFDCKGGTRLILNEVGACASGLTFRANSTENDFYCDTQGLVYAVSSSGAAVKEVLPASNGSHGSVAPTNADFDTDGITYTLGKNSENPVQVVCDFISPDRINYSGVPNNIKYIVIHNTGTTEEETDAERYNLRMHRTENETSWHYTVDDGIIYHSLQDSMVGWHAGSFYNYQSLGIEICTNGAPVDSKGNPVFSGTAYEKWVEERFDPALKNAAMLTAELLTRYGLGTDSVIQHFDATEKNCPLWLRRKGNSYSYEGTLWLRFMDYVNLYYLLLNGDAPAPYISETQSIVIPDYIATPQGEVVPVSELAPNSFSETERRIFSLTLGKNISVLPLGCFDQNESITDIFIHEENTDFFVDEKHRILDKNGFVCFDPAETSHATPSPDEGCELNICKIDGRYYIIFENEGYSLGELKRQYGASELFAFSLDGVLLADGDPVGTGATLKFDEARLYTVMKGDADGNAQVDTADYIMAKRSVLGSFRPLVRQVLAISFNRRGTVCAADYLMLKRHVLGTYDIYG